MTSSRIQSPSESTIAEAVRLLAAGELIGIPTETVYGLAADATNPSAVRKIFEVKGRPSNNPLIVHFSSASAARQWIRIDHPTWLTQQWEIAKAFWPGPLTVVVPHGGTMIDEVTAGAETVAVRVPDHPVMTALLEACPFPIAAPSANRSNYVSPTRARHVADTLGDAVALVIDGGSCRWGLESTIVRPCESGIQLLRPGGITAEQLESEFGSFAVTSSRADRETIAESEPMPAPGMLSKHYSPKKPLFKTGFLPNDVENHSKVARISFAPVAAEEAESFGWYRCLSDHGDLREVAQQLFDAMRSADESPCESILIDHCERSGIGRAIMDRIDRACG